MCTRGEFEIGRASDRRHSSAVRRRAASAAASDAMPGAQALREHCHSRPQRDALRHRGASGARPKAGWVVSSSGRGGHSRKRQQGPGSACEARNNTAGEQQGRCRGPIRHSVLAEKGMCIRRFAGGVGCGSVHTFGAGLGYTVGWAAAGRCSRWETSGVPRPGKAAPRHHLWLCSTCGRLCTTCQLPSAVRTPSMSCGQWT